MISRPVKVHLCVWICVISAVSSLPDGKISRHRARDIHDRDRERERHSQGAFSAKADTDTPEQVHLAFGTNTQEIVVMWVTANSSSSTVRYGIYPNDYSLVVNGETWQFTDGNPDGKQWYHRVVLQNLKANSKYSYLVESNGVQSRDYFFSVPPAEQATPFSFVMFGDMGKHGGSPTLPRLEKEAKSGSNVAMFHVGDFAYDLQSDGGANGDEFMRRVEVAAAHIPYMTCPGNHEIAFDFSHYRNRYTMPTPERTPKSDGLWYSIDIGKIHFISYDTEVYFARPDLIPRMLAFLENDLQKANTAEARAAVPWILAFGHRPFYCSNVDNDDCSTPRSKVRHGLEALFNKYGVDIIIEGHEHSYERLWPVFNETVTQFNYNNPRAPVHLISGVAGCNEDFGLCVNPTFGAKGKWSAFRSWLPGLNGYGKLTVINDTHVEWKQILDHFDGYAEDKITIIQENHGPFSYPA